VQAASDERRESLNSTQSNGGQKARRGSNGSSSGHGSIGSGSDPHAQTWTAIQTARSELDKGAKAKKVSENKSCAALHSYQLMSLCSEVAYCKLPKPESYTLYKLVVAVRLNRLSRL
jgi:hypothetical protein